MACMTHAEGQQRFAAVVPCKPVLCFVPAAARKMESALDVLSSAAMLMRERELEEERRRGQKPTISSLPELVPLRKGVGDENLDSNRKEENESFARRKAPSSARSKSRHAIRQTSSPLSRRSENPLSPVQPMSDNNNGQSPPSYSLIPVNCVRGPMPGMSPSNSPVPPLTQLTDSLPKKATENSLKSASLDFLTPSESAELAVDDHFRRSLGKGVLPASLNVHRSHAATSCRHDPVDDHFARALGKAWLDLKSSTETIS